jgi:hypothetical protein
MFGRQHEIVDQFFLLKSKEAADAHLNTSEKLLEGESKARWLNRHERCRKL